MLGARRSKDGAGVQVEDPAGSRGTALTGASDPTAATAGDADETDSRRAALDKVMGLMRPAVQADGGDLVLVSADYSSGVITVRLEGACGSCAISSATLQGGVERIVKDRLPWVTEVVGEVDDSLDFMASSSLGRGGYRPRAEG
jgi:Fe-S cluster biogenesis protein NfuA